jgi:ubiquinone/menaquinone biosynthesis C-methylase UbiE
MEDAVILDKGRPAGESDLHWQLVAQAGIEPGAVVLDIGTGSGNALLLAKRAVPGAKMIGLDLDAEALVNAERTASRAGLEVQLDRGSASTLPYEDGSVDRVLSAFMFHHLSLAEKHAVLLEVHRVLAPGGRLHLVDVDTDPRESGHGHQHALEPVLELMGEAGLVDAAEVGRGTALVGPHTYYRAAKRA